MRSRSIANRSTRCSMPRLRRIMSGLNFSATLRKPPFAATGSYTFVRSQEQDGDLGSSRR